MSATWKDEGFYCRVTCSPEEFDTLVQELQCIGGSVPEKGVAYFCANDKELEALERVCGVPQEESGRYDYIKLKRRDEP